MNLFENFNILIIDDEKELTDSLMRMLSGITHNVFEANSAAEALKILSTNDIHFCIIDIKLPESSGLELLDEINKLYPKIKSIILTGKGTKENVIEAFKFNALDFLEKPIIKEVFVQRVKNILTSLKIEQVLDRFVEEVVINFCNICTKERFEVMTVDQKNEAVKAAIRNFNKESSLSFWFKPKGKFEDMKILTVDDEDDIRFIINKVLTKLHVNIVEAEDGEVGLKILERDKVDLAIIDLTMPKLDGISLLKKVHKKYPNLISIILTGQATKERALKAFEYNAFDFLEKPIHTDVLRNRVANALKIKIQKDLVDSLVKEVVVDFCKYCKMEEYRKMSFEKKIKTLENSIGVIKGMRV